MHCRATHISLPLVASPPQLEQTSSSLYPLCHFCYTPATPNHSPCRPHLPGLHACCYAHRCRLRREDCLRYRHYMPYLLAYATACLAMFIAPSFALPTPHVSSHLRTRAARIPALFALRTTPIATIIRWNRAVVCCRAGRLWIVHACARYLFRSFLPVERMNGLAGSSCGTSGGACLGERRVFERAWYCHPFHSALPHPITRYSLTAAPFDVSYQPLPLPLRHSRNYRLALFWVAVIVYPLGRTAPALRAPPPPPPPARCRGGHAFWYATTSLHAGIPRPTNTPLLVRWRASKTSTRYTCGEHSRTTLRAHPGNK